MRSLFIYLSLHWVFIAALGLSLVVEGMGFSFWWLLLAEQGLQVHRLSCSAACEVFPEQGSNPCSLHWQADS